MFSVKKLLPALVLGVGLSGMSPPAQAADQMAPDFALPRSGDGRVVHLSDFKGKVRLVNFWATWCPPCRAEIPEFVRFYSEMRARGVEIIGISVDSNGDQAVAPFVEKNGVNYPMLLGDERTAKAYGGIRGIPTTFIVDRQGRIVKKYVGLPASDEAGIRTELMKVIGPLL